MYVGKPPKSMEYVESLIKLVYGGWSSFNSLCQWRWPRVELAEKGPC